MGIPEQPRAAGQPRAGGRAQRRALSVGLSSFASPGSDPAGEPATDAKGGLPFAAERTAAVAAALRHLGYLTTVADETGLPTARKLGQAVRRAITSGGNGDVQLVHVLSHGEPAPSGMHIVGADGDWTRETNVASWVAEIEDYPHKPRPHTLFLIDACHGGQAARLAWRPAAGPGTRAWVIAATEPDALAYEGRFSQAVATILDRVASGEIDLYPGEFVPFGDLVELIRQEVARLGGSHQRVTSTPVDGRPAPPFFVNPRQPTNARLARAKEVTDTAVVPFLDLDVALDAAHFLDRAAGHRFGAGLDVGCFTGRGDELTALAAWLDGERPGSLRVVTGGAGSGKSALLGVLVCAAHPGLRAATQRLWGTVAARLPAANPRLAAIHLRERDLGETLAALIRQLRLPLPESEKDPGAVVDAIAHRAEPPVIVVDALDEASGQDALVARLLVPLAKAARGGGAPACRLAVGMRPWEEFQPLRDLADSQGGLVDLDRVSAQRLEGELQDYVNDILSLVSYPLPSRRALKGAVAAALTAPDRQRGGEFLAAALYTNWLTGAYPDGVSQDQAADLAGRVPRTFPELLELDLESHGPDPWPIAVLTAAAYAHGAGMPATVLMRLAPLFLGDGSASGSPASGSPASGSSAAGRSASGSPAAGRSAAALTVAEFGRVLAQVRFYLRSSPDTDGTTLYRLFHQGLADHLRAAPAGLGGLLDRLLVTAPLGRGGKRRWAAAEPYVRRHAIQHAVDAGRLGELIRLDPDRLEEAFNTAATPDGRRAAVVYQQSRQRYRDSGALARRDLLAINAARCGAPDLVAALAGLPGLPAAGRYWRPAWATGGQLRAAYLAIMTGHTGAVAAVACTMLEGRPVAVTGGKDGAVRVWDLARSRLRPGRQPARTTAVTALACATLPDGPVAVTGGETGMIQVWDLASGLPRFDPVTGHAGRVAAVACATLDGRPVAVSGAEDGVRVWDLATGRAVKPPAGQFTAASPQRMARSGDGGGYLYAHNVRALACGPLPDGTAVVTAGDHQRVLGESGQPAGGPPEGLASDSPVQVWDLATARLLATARSEGFWRVAALASTTLDGRPVAVGGAEDLQVWDLRTGQLVTGPLEGHTDQVNAIDCTTLEGRAVAVSGAGDGTVRIWDLASGELHGVPLTGDFKSVTAVACSALEDRPVAVTGGSDGAVRVWDLAADHSEGRPQPVHTSVVFSVACGLSAGRPVAVTCGRDISVRVWDLTGGQVRDKALVGHAHWARAVACTTVDGAGVAVTGGTDGTVRVWDLATGEPRGEPLLGHLSTVYAVATTELAGRPVAVSGGFDGMVRVWDLGAGELRGRPLAGHEGWVWGAACTVLDGRPVAVTTGSDGTVRVWDLAAGRAWGKPLTGHAREVTAVDCAMVDGRPVAVSAGQDGTVRVWDLATGRARGEPLTGHAGKVWTVACTELDGRPVAVSSGKDQTMRTWDLAGHRELAVTTLPGLSYALAATPAGDLVVTFGWELCAFSRYWQAGEP